MDNLVTSYDDTNIIQGTHLAIESSSKCKWLTLYKAHKTEKSQKMGKKLGCLAEKLYLCTRNLCALCTKYANMSNLLNN